MSTDAEHAATQLLETIWSDRALPVDPIKIARALGIKVYRATLPPDIAGLLLKQPDLDPKIYISDSDSEARQRFTCAHELGHFVRRGGEPESTWATIDYRSAASSRGTDPEEIYANQFAAALLMPADRLTELARKLTLPALAYEFGVSLEAMSHRLANLNLKAA